MTRRQTDSDLDHSTWLGNAEPRCEHANDADLCRDCDECRELTDDEGVCRSVGCGARRAEKDHPTMNVYEAIAAVSTDIAKRGIAKDRSNQQQGYKFRGIDDVYNSLAPLLAQHGLVILPRMLARTQTERVSVKGAALFAVVVEAEFDFVSSADGTRHTVRTFGEAMDSGDKATNKAMSAAYKYAAFQAFCIPTEGDNDADHTTHEVAAVVPVAPAGFDEWAIDLRSAAETGTKALREAWMCVTKERRLHFESTHPGALDELKRIAAAADAKVKESA